MGVNVPALPDALWTAGELAEATGGHWVHVPPSSWLPTGISFAENLKYLRPGDIHVLLDKAHGDGTESRDGTGRLPALMAAGISAIVTHDDILSAPAHLPLLRVPDARRALFAIARAARTRFAGRAIAVTGTVGKTTTRGMLGHVLAQQGPTFATRANFNTWLGVPMSLAETPRSARYAVYEAAITSFIRKSGAIAHLVRPHAAVFTAIGEGPDRHAASMEETADLKARLFRGLEPGGTAIINRDMPLFERVHSLAREYKAPQIVLFGQHPDAHVRLLEADLHSEWGLARASIHGEQIDYEVPLPGRAMVMNTLAVLAAVHAVGGDWRKAAGDLARYETQEGRLRRFLVPIPGGEFEFIDDTFNAEQASMLSNFEVLSLARPASGGRRIAVLGEIGDLLDPKLVHVKLAAPLREAGVNLVFTLGDGLNHLRRELPEHMLGLHAENAKQLAAAVLAEVRPGDVVSAKGCSVTAKFDRVAKYLRSGRSPIDGTAAVSRKVPDVAEMAPSRPSLAPDAPSASLDGMAQRQTPIAVRSRQRIDLCFLGDTYFGEYYQARRAKSGKINYLKEHGYAHSLKSFESFLRRADLVIANLETTLTKRTRSPLAGKKDWILGGNPAATVRALQGCNVGAVALGNNHAIDYGEPGLVNTIAALEARGIHWFGAGINAAEAERPLRITTSLRDRALGLSVFSAYQYARGYDEDLNGYATPDHSGVACMSTDMLEAIATLKRAEPLQFLVAFPHWGKNYKWRSANQAEMADWLLAAGADLVIGHGAHMMQEIERRSDRWVVYGLGNFVFNSDGEYERRRVPPYSLLARLRLTHDVQGIDKALYLYPIVSDNQLTLFRPRFVDASEFAAVVQRLTRHCADLDPARGLATTGRDDHGWYMRLALGDPAGRVS